MAGNSCAGVLTLSSRVDHRLEITDALKAFAAKPVRDAAKELLQVLGYASKRTVPISTPGQFLKELDPDDRLTERDRDAFAEITSLRLLFQFTDAELTAQKDLFDSGTGVETTQIQSYLFFAVELSKEYYTRSVISGLLRAINKPLPMPAIVLFKHGTTVSLGIIHRRLNKRDRSRDVLEKVTLVKDIHYDDPIRAHVEILNDFAFENLDADYGVGNFVQLHEAWQKRLGSYALSNEFYREIADWYFWAHHQVADETIRLPKHCDTEQEQSLFLIRLLTRVIFCWFLVEKRLIPNELFRERWLRANLRKFTPGRTVDNQDTSPTFYHAILQNLFFGTLNMPTDNRAFREKKREGERYDKNYGITNLWRYEADFKDPSVWVSICERIPFLNGGLFDCLDDKIGHKDDNFLLDGFSDNPKLSCLLPNDLFFGPERTVDLSKDYGEEGKKTARSKKAKVRGLVEILSRYKFTVEENTPLEEEIALDPELLGKVFENLLASYNEDTKTTARKALGAFYTPREIVSYMVDESLKSYLGTQVPRCKGALEDLFSNKATLKEISPNTREALIAAIGRVKILDPACGSGAFPMGALHRLVDLLQKLDPDNDMWREIQRQRALAETEEAFKSGNRESREQRLKEINDTFEFNSSDYGRKLYLIENSIYGVDIQPIATQIAKLRFFIALVVEQKVTPAAPNLGVLPLPNLETRIVAADTLIPINKEEDGLFSKQLNDLRQELSDIRHEHFNARSPYIKRKWRNDDAAKRREISELLEDDRVLDPESARKLAAWDPYDQNTFAPFFDAQWMFGLSVGKSRERNRWSNTFSDRSIFVDGRPREDELVQESSEQSNSGFDIVIGNPPYVLLQSIGLTGEQLAEWRKRYLSAQYKVDLYQVFFEASISFLRPNGVLSFITPNTFLKNKFSAALRKLLLTESQPLAFLLFYYPVFPGQSVDNAVSIWRKRETPDVSALASIRSVSVNSRDDLLSPLRWRVTPASRIVPPSYELELDVDESAAGVLNLVDSISQPLGNYCGAYFGIQTFDRTQFVSSKALTKHFQSVIDGTNVKRWCYTPPNEFVDFRSVTIKSGGDPAIYSRARIVVRQIGVFPMGCLCPAGLLTLNTIYNIYEKESEGRLSFYLGIINSTLVAFYWRLRFFDNKETFPKIKKSPLLSIPIPNATNGQRREIERLVVQLTYIAGFLASQPTTQTTRDPLMLAYWERVLNGLVYELYFPSELHAAGLHIFDLVAKAELGTVDLLDDCDSIPALRESFGELYDPSHPLRIALDKLQTIDTVRVIEAKG